MIMSLKKRISVFCLVFILTMTGILHIEDNSSFIIYAASESEESVDDSNINSIVLHADDIYDSSASWTTGGARLYYGAYDGSNILFRILPDSPATQYTDGDCMLLDADTIWKIKTESGNYVYFPLNGVVSARESQTSGKANEWNGCDLQTYLERRYIDSVNGSGWFSPIEAEAIADTSLLSQTGYEDNENPNGWFHDYSSNGHIFIISAREVFNLYEDRNSRKKEGRNGDGNGLWWVRSANESKQAFAGFVVSNASVLNAYVDYINYLIWLAGGINLNMHIEDGAVCNANVDAGIIGFCPAINLKLSSVLFFSDVTDGAFSKDVSIENGKMTEAVGNTWKATVVDSAKSVNVQENERAIITRSGYVTIPYAYTDSNADYPVNQVTVIITNKDYQDEDAEILYYGSLLDSLDDQTEYEGVFKGVGEFKLPSDLPEGYKIYLIAEHISETTETDYSSPMQIINPVPQCDLLYGANGGFGFMEGETVCVGDSVTLPECRFEAPEGKEFDKWSEGEVGDTIIIYEDTLILAEWVNIPEPTTEEATTEEATTEELTTEEATTEAEIETEQSNRKAPTTGDKKYNNIVLALLVMFLTFLDGILIIKINKK